MWGEKRGRAMRRSVCLALLLVVVLVCVAILSLRDLVPARRAAPVHAHAPSVMISRARVLPQYRSLADQPSAHLATPPGNFPFQIARSADGKVIVHYYNQPASYGSNFVGMVEQALQQYVEPTLGYPLLRPVNIYVYNSRADFLAGAVPYQPELTGAYTLPISSTVYMQDYYDADTFGTLSHELTHVVFHQHENAGHLENDYYLYPRWLDEGMAERDVPAYTPGAAYDDAVLQQALANGTFVNIFTSFLWDYPTDPSIDDLCYAEARNFIQHLERTYGMTRFHAFVRDVADGDFNFAALAAFGVDIQTLHSGWNVSLGQPALHHAAGGAPNVPTPLPIIQHQMPKRDTSLSPDYSPAGGDVWLQTSLVQAAIGAAGVLLGLISTAAVALLRRRRATRRASQPPASPAPPQAWESLGPATAPLGFGPRAPTELAGVSVAVAVPATMPATRPHARVWRVLEVLALALLLPLALGLSALWTQLDSTRSWRNEYLVAAAQGALACVIAVVLLALAARARRVLVAHVTTPVALLVLAVLALTTASPAGLAEGKAYLHDEAFALAYTTLQQAGASKSQLADAQLQWAQAAALYLDYPDALIHYRAALALGLGSRQHDTQATALSMALTWGAMLAQAHQYTQALQTYAAQLSLASCNQSCQTALKEAGGEAELAWANDLITTGQVPEAETRLQDVVHQFGGSKAATSASVVLGHLSAGLDEAAALGRAGDTTAMDLLLALIAVQHPGTVEANEAAAASQPVTGSLLAIEVYKPDVHIYFMGFATRAAAQAFLSSYNTDISLIKVAAQADSSGNFSVLLPAGYTYDAFWEAPSRNGVDDWIYSSTQSFAVERFTPLALSYVLSS